VDPARTTSAPTSWRAIARAAAWNVSDIPIVVGAGVMTSATVWTMSLFLPPQGRHRAGTS
jgi:hypothetical protein